MEILDVNADGAGLVITVETTGRVAVCVDCGGRAHVRDRPRVVLADLPAFGQATTMVWVKRRWRCSQRCGARSWTEVRDDIAPVRAQMTRRAGVWATVQVGRFCHAVSWAASELGVAWHTVMDAVTYWGNQLITDPGRVGVTKAVGVDETCFLSATATARTQWVSTIVDVTVRQVIDVIEGRQAPDLHKWLDIQTGAWKAAVEVTVCDLHEPFRAALARHFPDAVMVADPFHVVGVANRVLDKTRRRVQNETLGHRGRKGDALYRARKLLLMAGERLDHDAKGRLGRFLDAGDPTGQIHEAWLAKECLRDLYSLHGHRDTAALWLDALVADCTTAAGIEARGMARTLKRWRSQILAWHTTGVSNGPTEGLNSVIKKVKRVAAGFRSFPNYRTRILLACGGCNWDLLNPRPR